MILQTYIVKSDKSICEHYIPFWLVESYGRYDEVGPGVDETHVIMKSGGEYRVKLNVDVFHKKYVLWSEGCAITN